MPRIVEKSRLVRCALLLSSSLLVLGACSEEDTDTSNESVVAPDCEAINDVCHVPAELTALTAECHEIAHYNDAAECAARKAECLVACTAPGGNGGAGGGAG